MIVPARSILRTHAQYYNILRRTARRYFLRRFAACHALRDNQLPRFHSNLRQIAGKECRA